jgi:tRNA (guanosine-2'-O-)-methyltransferase
VTPKRRKKIKDVIAGRERHLCIVLEDIHDPHNAAAILRTADAFGIQDIRFIFKETKAYNPKKVGKASSSSANKWLSFTIYHSPEACVQALKKEQYRMLGTVLHPKAKNLFTAKIPLERIAILVGNEKRGLSETMIRASDDLIEIPMRGMVQSLNVSVATALVISEIVKRRKGRYHLKTKEQKTLEGILMKDAS